MTCSVPPAEQALLQSIPSSGCDIYTHSIGGQAAKGKGFATVARQGEFKVANRALHGPHGPHGCSAGPALYFTLATNWNCQCADPLLRNYGRN